MKTIKFRGKQKGGRDDGKFIHGYFAEKFNDDGELVPVIIWDTENPAYFTEVYPDSVAELVGHDADGKEVYEGDEVDVENGTLYASVIKYLKTEKNSILDFDECAKKSGWKLKNHA